MINSIEDYLQMLAAAQPPRAGWFYSGMADFLLKHGKSFEAAPLAGKAKHGIPRMCFQNAYKLAVRKRWLYVEGMAMGIIPVHHAFCVNPDEPTIAIDPTWREPGTEYFGVAFDLTLVGKARKSETTMLDDWRGGFQIYHKEWGVVHATT